MQLVTMNMLIQLMVPNELRGRVFSIYLWALQGVAPFGSLLDRLACSILGRACGGIDRRAGIFNINWRFTFDQPGRTTGAGLTSG